MKRLAFLRALVGLPLVMVGGGAMTGEEKIPDDVADKITIIGEDGHEYQFKPGSMRRRANVHQNHLNDHLGADTWDMDRDLGVVAKVKK